MSDDLICIEVDPADYGWTRRPALDDADVVDVLRLLRGERGGREIIRSPPGAAH
jgi:hypothetical protein